MKNNIIPEIPKILSGTYKLSDDAIRAIEDKVAKRFEYFMKNNSFEEAIFKRYQEQLDKYMMKQYPDLSNRLNSLSLTLDEQVKMLSKNLKEIEKREKSVLKSESLYKDFFDLKDRVKVLDDFICTFKSKLKKSLDL